MNTNTELGLPDKLELHKYTDYMRISRNWFGMQVIIYTVFAVFWNIFLINFYSKIDADADIITLLFPLAHVAVGIGISYYAIAGWLNKSNIYVSSETIEINHKPMPWFGSKRLAASEIAQLYAKEKISNNRNSTSVRYEVHVILKNNTNMKLLGGLENSEQALYIEQEIEKYLGIEDADVKGSIR